VENSTSSPEIESSEDEFTEVTHRKRKRAKTSGAGTDTDKQVRGPIKVKRPSDRTCRTVYIKGQSENLAKALELANVRSFKRAVIEAVGVTESIDCRGDSVRIVCKNELQKTTLLGLSELAGKPIVVSVPWSIKKQVRRETNRWSKGVITRVPLDLTVEDIKEETGCIWAH